MSTGAWIVILYLLIGLSLAAFLCAFAYKKGARAGLAKLFIYGALFWPLTIAGAIFIFIKSNDKGK